MTDITALVRRYFERYNASDVAGMLECCADEIVFETISNPGGSMKLNGKAEMAEVLDATTRAFRQRRHTLVRVIADGEVAASETVFTAVASTDLSENVRAGEHVSIRGATIFECANGRLTRICDYS